MTTYFGDLFIDGSWRSGADGERFDVRDPADGTTITTVAKAEIVDCLAAVESAAGAAEAWSQTAPRQRAEILRTAFDIMTLEAEDFATLISRENGKSLADARSETSYAAEFFRWYSEEAVRISGDYRLSPTGDKRIVVTHEPIGVSLLITPWNFPAAMATRKIAPALAAGCTVVLKPATETPLTAGAIVDVLVRAGVPAGVVNYVTPRPASQAVSAMLSHPAVRKLSFTGSTEVGRILLREAADRVISSSMELGGNAPFVVLSDADLDGAVAGAMVAKFRNGGAACTAANRFYVHRSVASEFSRRLTDSIAGTTYGPAEDPANAVGALVSVAERDKVGAIVDRAVTQGATIAVGGFIPDGAGAFYPPTLLEHVLPEADITQAEIFGPVLPVVVFDSEDEAVEWSNNTDMGLIAYVYGSSDSAMRLAHRLQAGMVAVNRGVLSDPAAPFGGVKQSGLGREGGAEGIEEYLEKKYIAVDV